MRRGLAYAAAMVPAVPALVLGAARHDATGRPAGTATFGQDGMTVTLTHPTWWSSQLGPFSAHYLNTLGYLATFPLRLVCHDIGPGPPPGARGGSRSCTRGHLGPGDGVLIITEAFFPGGGDRFSDMAGEPAVVAGRPARRVMAPECPAFSGHETAFAWAVDNGSSQGHLRITACLAGPNLTRRRAEVEGMIASARITPAWDAGGMTRGGG